MGEDKAAEMLHDDSEIGDGQLRILGAPHEGL